MSGVIHIAGPPIQIGDHLRQRCAWCGATLLDYDLSNIATPVPEGKTEPQARADGDFRPGTWLPGGLIAIDGPLSYLVPHTDGDRLPDSACGQLDHEVTR